MWDHFSFLSIHHNSQHFSNFLLAKRLSKFVVSMEESVKEALSTCFYVFFYAILRCKSFKIRVNFHIESLKIYGNMVLTSFF